jgi:hypothetical protein
MAPRKAQKAVDSRATQLRAVALYFVSGIHTPLPGGADHSRDLRATALPGDVRAVRPKLAKGC